MAKLNPRYKAVVDAIVSGKSHDEACLTVYPQRIRWTQNARICDVCKILSKPQVKAYYEEQRAKLDKAKSDAAIDEALWSFRESVQGLQFVIRLAQRDAMEISKRNEVSETYERAMPTTTANSIIGAIDKLNRMFGFDTPKETDDEADDEITFVDDIRRGEL